MLRWHLQGPTSRPAIRRHPRVSLAWSGPDLACCSRPWLLASAPRPDLLTIDESLPSRVGCRSRSSSCCSFFCWPGGGDLDQAWGCADQCVCGDPRCDSRFGEASHFNSTCCCLGSGLCACLACCSRGLEPAVRALCGDCASCWGFLGGLTLAPRRGDRLGISPPPAQRTCSPACRAVSSRAGGIDQGGLGLGAALPASNADGEQGPAGPASRRSPVGVVSRARCRGFQLPSPPGGRRCKHLAARG